MKINLSRNKKVIAKLLIVYARMLHPVSHMKRVCRHTERYIPIMALTINRYSFFYLRLTLGNVLEYFQAATQLGFLYVNYSITYFVGVVKKMGT